MVSYGKYINLPDKYQILQTTKQSVSLKMNTSHILGAAIVSAGLLTAACTGRAPEKFTDYVDTQMSIMMKAFTADDDKELQDCIRQLLVTDAGTGFIHESFNKDDASDFTRE